jgi:hypothetical protein
MESMGMKETSDERHDDGFGERQICFVDRSRDTA